MAVKVSFHVHGTRQTRCTTIIINIIIIIIIIIVIIIIANTSIVHKHVSLAAGQLCCCCCCCCWTVGIISLKYLSSFVVVVKVACSSPLLLELIINLALFIKLSADNLCAPVCVCGCSKFAN